MEGFWCPYGSGDCSKLFLRACTCERRKKNFPEMTSFFMTSFFCDDVISGSAIFVRDTLALIIGPYRVREKAVTVISSPPVDPLRIFTGPNGDFDWTHLGL